MEIVKNKHAYHDYEILETVEAGIALLGDEVKSIRRKTVSLADSFAVINQGNLSLLNCYIAPYSHAFTKKDISRRSRGLLLHRREINRITGAVSKKGLTLIPLSMHFNDRGYVKVIIGIAKHKKMFDKRATIKERDIKRETERDIKQRLR